MTHTGHETVLCDTCNGQISNCRCMSLDKKIRYETCESCQVLVDSMVEVVTKHGVPLEVVKKTIREA